MAPFGWLFRVKHRWPSFRHTWPSAMLWMVFLNIRNYMEEKRSFCNQRMWKDSNKNGHSVSFFLFGYPGDLWPFNRFYWNRLNLFHRENKQVPRICGSWSCILQSFLVFSWAGTCLHTKYSCFQSLQVNTQNVIYWILWNFWFTKRKNCESLWLKALSLA